MATATGKFSYGLCDYCGRRYRYQDLKKNWKGFMVCPEDYEPKEPQIEPLQYKGDAIALKDPRPDRTERLDVFVGQEIFPPLKTASTHAITSVGKVEVVIS